MNLAGLWPSSRWGRVALIWTGLILLLILPSWPAATAPRVPCGYQGDPNRDLGMPLCPMDEINGAALAIFLLALLWVAGIVVLLLAYVISRLARRWPAPTR